MAMYVCLISSDYVYKAHARLNSNTLTFFFCESQSFTKDYSTQLRYESLMRRHERLDDAMYYWSHQKYLGMADLLQEVR